MQKTKAPLSAYTVDSEGNVPDLRWLGIVLEHQGNLKSYKILSYVWNGASDTWMFCAQECDENNDTLPSAVAIVRPDQPYPRQAF